MKCTRITSRFGNFIGEKPSLETPRTVRLTSGGLSMETVQISGFLEPLDTELEFDDWVDVGPEFI